MEEITHDKVLVSPAAGEPGKMPFWRGDRAGRSRALCDAHIARAARTLVDGDALARVAAVGLERAVPTLLTLALGVTLIGGWAALSPESLKLRLAKLVDDRLIKKNVAEVKTPDTVNEFARKQILPAFKTGRQWRFRRQDIASFKRHLRGASAA